MNPNSPSYMPPAPPPSGGGGGLKIPILFGSVLALLGANVYPFMQLDKTKSDVKALQASGVELHAAAHITGGGLPENLPRAIPDGMRAVLKRGTWPQAPAIAHVLACGAVDEESAMQAFNMGLGMCLVMPAAAAERALDIVQGSHVVGRVEAGPAGLAWED